MFTVKLSPITALCGLFLLNAHTDHCAAAEIPGDLFAGIENFGITVKVSLQEGSGEGLPYRSVVYNNFFNTSGMFRAELKSYGEIGNQIDDEVVAYDGTNTLYYIAPHQNISTKKGLHLDSNLLDMITRASLYQFQFLFPNREHPLDKETSRYRPEYKAAYVGDLINVGLWNSAQQAMSTVEEAGDSKTIKLPVVDFTYPTEEGQLTLIFYQDLKRSFLPYRIEKTNSKGEVLEEFEVEKWSAIMIPLGKSMEKLPLNIPVTARYKALRSNYSVKIEYSNVVVNSPELDDPDFYTVDFALAKEIFDSDSQMSIKVPR